MGSSSTSNWIFAIIGFIFVIIGVDLFAFHRFTGSPTFFFPPTWIAYMILTMISLDLYYQQMGWLIFFMGIFLFYVAVDMTRIKKPLKVENDAIETLRMRLARGEITKEEYDDILKKLTE